MHFFHPANDTLLQQNKIDTSSYRKKTLALIAIFSFIKLILAFLLELGNDEAYYWLYSQYWQWNYFDHPPMVALWIRLFTMNLSLEQYEGFIRLGSVAGSALSTWFLYKAVTQLHSAKAGWFTAVLYNISFYSAITAGLYILPDSPQMVFWALALLLIARITRDDRKWSSWLLFGIVAGLCIMSKIHGAFLWSGLGGYALFSRNAWLKKPQLYVAFLITAIIISPIFFWNLRYDFATFRFHSNRIEPEELVFHLNFLFRELKNQVAFNNPVNFFLVLSALIAWYRKRIWFQPALAIYTFIALPLITLLLFISMFRNVTLPHWNGPAYVSLLPLAGVWLAQVSEHSFPKILRWGLAILLVSYLGYCLVIKFYPGTYGSQSQENFGRGDVTLDMFGWREAGRQFQAFYNNDVSTGIMPQGAPLVTSNWWGAHEEYYFGRPLHLIMIGLGKPEHLNEYLWTNRFRKDKADLNRAYCIIPADDKYFVPSDFFQRKELALIINVKRNGKPAHQFLVYRLSGLRKQIPVVK